MQLLRTNTATRVTVGPIYDTDGLTPKTVLTVTGLKLSMTVDDGGVPTLVLDTAPTASGGANDMVHITGDDSGFFDLELAAANVNYLGRARLALSDAANICPVFHEFLIVPANVYDSLLLGTDVLDVSVTQWLGTAAATPTVAGVPEVDLTHVAGATTNVAALATNADAIKAKTDNLPTDPADASVISGRFDTLDTAVADLPTNAELATALGTADDAVLAAIAALNNLSSAQAQTAAAAALTAYDGPTHAEMTAELATADDAVLSAIATLSAAVDVIDNFLDTEIAAITTAVVSARAEPVAVPAANATLGQKVDWLFMQSRNKRTTTASEDKVFADDGSTTVGTAAVADDGTTFSRNEFA